MQTIGAFQAKTHFSSLLDQVEKGEHVVITKHGRRVAKLVPIRPSEEGHTTKQIITELKTLSQRHLLNFNWKKLRDEGRY